MRYADLHIDTLTLSENADGFLHRKNACASLEKLVEGGCFLQCFAVFCDSRAPDAWAWSQMYLAAFEREKATLAASGICGIATVEDGGIVNAENGSLERAEFLVNAGVKMFGFTWNYENCLGYPNGTKGGLKPFGKKTAEFLLSKGVIPDLSHLSDDGVADILNMAQSFHSPVAASHSLSRSVCAHSRNLTDEQIKGIADSGGVIGVNFVRKFIGEAGIFAHIRHIFSVGGEDVLALGTDFDGTKDPLYKGADEMPKFFADLNKAGFSARVIEKLAYQNASRLLLKKIK